MSGQTQFTGGLEAVEIDAPRVRELRLALAERFPALGPQLRQVAFAIDGQIYHDADYHKLTATSDIRLLPRLGGG
ncbi:MAG: MoaD/ThiS family protein [Gammaproteobacteria bacterium]